MGDRDNIMIFVGNAATPNLRDTLIDHYTEAGQKRWARLGQCQFWAVPDLLGLFTHWNTVLNALKMNLRNAEISGQKGNLPVMIQTRLLHQQMATAIELREVLRIHKAIAECIRRLGQSTYANEAKLDLFRRIGMIEDQMNYDATTIDTIKEQLQNLIQLVRLSARP